MKTAIISLIFSLTFTCVHSQEMLFNYQLKDSLVYDSLIAGVEDKEAATLLDKRFTELLYTGNQGNLTEFLLIHKRIYVNSEKAVSENNKVYLNMSASTDLNNYNARVITPRGDIVELGKDALKEGTTEDDVTYKYFAIAGAEVGAVIEFFYVIERSPEITGLFISFQSDYPTKKCEFTIASPENLLMATKSINGFNEMKQDTNYVNENVLHVSMKDIPALSEEEFANVKGNRMGVIYHLKANTQTGNNNVFNYGDVSQSIFERLNPELSRRNKKDLEKMLKKAQINISLDKRDKIFKIENYVKMNFAIVEAPVRELQDIEFILDKEICNETGASMLLYQLYQLADIPVEIVLTSSRYKLRFYKEFETFAYLDTYLLYFPEIDDYLIPSGTMYRVGLIPYGYINNHGLFVKTIEIGDLRSGAGRVKFIEPYPAEHTLHDMNIDVTFNDELSSVDVDLEQSHTGYYAFNFQPYFTYIEDEEEKNNLKEAIAKSINEDIEINEITLRNEGVEQVMRKPLQVSCSFSSTSFLDRAGDKALFKVGQLIGPQAQLYQESERRNPVENTYNRQYNRVIKFNIPEGYQCLNLEDLNLIVQPFLDGDDGAGFVSRYEVDGNEVTVTINEYYPQLEFPLEQYPEYRQVINAAADFNKITLVLEKS